jgi:hypothetical protein
MLVSLPVGLIMIDTDVSYRVPAGGSFRMLRPCYGCSAYADTPCDVTLRRAAPVTPALRLLTPLTDP